MKKQGDTIKNCFIPFYSIYNCGSSFSPYIYMCTLFQNDPLVKKCF